MTEGNAPREWLVAATAALTAEERTRIAERWLQKAGLRNDARAIAALAPQGVQVVIGEKWALLTYLWAPERP